MRMSSSRVQLRPGSEVRRCACRSRARSSTHARYLGFLVMGEAMQTATWVDFVTSVAFTFAEGVIGYLHVETSRLPRGRADELEASALSPTFIAEGD